MVFLSIPTSNGIFVSIPTYTGVFLSIPTSTGVFLSISTSVGVFVSIPTSITVAEYYNDEGTCFNKESRKQNIKMESLHTVKYFKARIGNHLTSVYVLFVLNTQ